MSNIDWNQKTVALLHDPPEKAYDYSRKHLERAESHLRNLQVPDSAWKGKEPDHAAAAADRFIFPGAWRRHGATWIPTGVGNLGEGVRFKHPLTGHSVLSPEDFPGEDEAHHIISQALPDFADKGEALKFWLLWRLWLQFSVEHQQGKDPKAGNLAYLPADTRIPDGSIWHHMSVVSALEATRDASGMLQPAFLMFQVGPVQECIAQARSTRDLWSGSYLLSWMMAHALKTLADEFGPDCVIYPSLRGQPLYDWLEQEKLKQARHRTDDGKESKSFWEELRLGKNQDLALTPNLPNRFLAIVPASSAEFVKEKLVRMFDAAQEGSEWRRICEASWSFLPARDKLPGNAKGLWDFQVRNFWQVTWQLWPWQEVAPSLNLFQGISFGEKSSLHSGWTVAMAIPDDHKDERCYRGGKLNSGWAWSAHYQLLSHRHDARRQTRDFNAWQTNGKPGHKDYFSGKEEAIATKVWLADARRSDFGHLFRHDDELGALNLIKRVWHKAYLEKTQGFIREEFKFESVPGIAAAPWRKEVKKGLLSDAEVCLVLRDFKQAVENAQEILDFDLCVELDESRWLDRVDASIFQSSFWERLKLESSEEPLRDRAAASLRELLAKAKAGQPGNYFAVLALDGDQIGKWLSGEKTPSIRKVISDQAADYFHTKIEPEKLTEGTTVKDWLDSNRPLSPSYHLQFSEALANFGLYCARRIVEAHHGQLIYSGGDDVLAMLPAGEAIACAQGLRLAFQGKSKELVAHTDIYASLFDETVPEGFIRLKDGDWNQGCRRPAEPSWPLLVPGAGATVSVGVAIGHIKEPLQDMIKEAQVAEKRAKNLLGRNAIAVTLFKRSGELIKWGSSFAAPEAKTGETDSASLRLLRFIQSDNRYRKPLDQPAFEPPMSGKFPYRLAELLARYQDYESHDGQRDLSRPSPLTAELRHIAEREIEWAVSRQCSRLQEEDRTMLLKLSSDYLCELEYRGRPLSDFIYLFALEAFIARQGE